MSYCVYVLQNTINQKIYVGFSRDPIKRWAYEKKVASLPNRPEHGTALSRAIRKYGWETFTKQTIEEFSTKQEALDAEVFWIEFFRSNCALHGSAYGYNMTPGGENPPSPLGKTLSAETRARMSAAQKGRAKSAEHRAKIGLGCMGRQISAKQRLDNSRRQTGKIRGPYKRSQCAIEQAKS